MWTGHFHPHVLKISLMVPSPGEKGHSNNPTPYIRTPTNNRYCTPCRRSLLSARLAPPYLFPFPGRTTMTNLSTGLRPIYLPEGSIYMIIEETIRVCSNLTQDSERWLPPDRFFPLTLSHKVETVQYGGNFLFNCVCLFACISRLGWPLWLRNEWVQEVPNHYESSCSLQ